MVYLSKKKKKSCVCVCLVLRKHRVNQIPSYPNEKGARDKSQVFICVSRTE